MPLSARPRPGKALDPAAAGAPRVVFVRHSVSLRTGGLTKAWLRRIRLLHDAGWDVHVALIDPERDTQATLRTLREEGALPTSVTVHLFGRGRWSPHRIVSRLVRRSATARVARWLDDVVSRDGALVFADSPPTYTHLARMRNPRAATVYVVHLAHLSLAATKLGTPGEIANGPMTERWGALSEETIRAADRIVVLTQDQKRDFQLRWGSELAVEVIPHCADPFETPDEGYDPRLVVVLGRLSRGKRWDDAIRSMTVVLRSVPDARLVIYGHGEERESLEALVATLGLTDSVTFAGYTTSPRAAMASAACVISTTRREAMPLTLLECLSVGTPVVVYDIRYGPREIVRDGVDGFVLPVHDWRASGRAVVRILTEPGLRDRMSAEARTVTSRFSVEGHDRAWLELCREVYDQRGSSLY